MRGLPLFLSILLAVMSAQAADERKPPSRVIDLRSVKSSIEGDILLRVNRNELATLTEDVVPGRRPFTRGEPFLALIPQPDDVTHMSPSPCAGEEGVRCIPKMTPIGWVCRCDPVIDKGIPKGGGAVPEKCRLAFSKPVTEGISPLACVSLKACPTCCRLARTGDGKEIKIGCQCQDGK